MPVPTAHYTVGSDGWVDPVRRLPSPNADSRPPDTAITLVVLHNISLPPGRYGGGHIERLFTNRVDVGAHPYLDRLRQARVSAHFLIARDGGCIQFVSCLDRAWHAGASAYAGRARCNDYSIGIELEGSDFEPFADVQYSTLNALLASLSAGYPLHAVVGHQDIAPGRKTDPGPYFDWQRLELPLALRTR